MSETSKIRVAVIVGSRSDLPAVEKSGMFQVFDGLLGRQAWELSVISADRHPDALRRYCREKYNQGVDVFLAIAGMAAVLPSAIAQCIEYRRPVIGAGVANGFGSGVDTLLAMACKPKGAPILTTGVGSAALNNAALAACQIIALTSRNHHKEGEIYDFIQNNNPVAEIGVAPEEIKE